MADIRWELGPVISSVTSPAAAPDPAPAAPSAPAAAPKLDIDVQARAVDGWTVPVTVPAYDLATYNHLVKLRAYLVPAGETLPNTAAELVSSAHPFSEVDTTGHQEGFVATVTLPQVPPASQHTALVVRGFES